MRSSPVLGRTPNGNGEIVYVGSSNGKLYALDAATGARRWSFDTTPKKAPRCATATTSTARRRWASAASTSAASTAGSGSCPTTTAARRATRAATAARRRSSPTTSTSVFPVTPGGTTKRGDTREGPRRDRARHAAGRPRGRPAPRRDAGDPELRRAGQRRARRSAFQTQLSGDGHYLFIRPDGFLEPGTDYRVRVAGLGGGAGPGASTHAALPHRRRRAAASCRCPWGASEVGALEISRLALPLPSLLPSVNQIGFDSYDLIAGTLRRQAADGSDDPALGDRRARGPQRRSRRPTRTATSPSRSPARYRGDEVMLNASRLDLQFSFGPVPIRSLDFRGELGADGRFGAGASLYGQVTCAEVPNYSVYLYVAGVCNPNDTLASYGTFLSDAYNPKRDRQPQAEGRARRQGHAQRADAGRRRRGGRPAEARPGRPLPGRASTSPRSCWSTPTPASR